MGHGHSMHKMGAKQARGKSFKKCALIRGQSIFSFTSYVQVLGLGSNGKACGYGESFLLKAHGHSLSVGEDGDGSSFQAFHGSLRAYSLF